ncbi:MBL fold metallo-hydrolase [Candidatus Woesebacteria bacterium]|nr:MAG: MBL fold metallo-hydrolase [Candidatus Woesebacteria bacterium]
MHRLLIFVGVLVTTTLCSTLILLPDSNLHIISCDVGQGDATLVVYKDKQIVVDAGPVGGGAVECLNKHMPFWDREIELVILTHPQIDHFGGLIEIAKMYKVDNFVSSGLGNSTPEYQALINVLGGSEVRLIIAQDTASIGIGVMYLDILHPNENFIRQNCNLLKPDDDGLIHTMKCDSDPNDYSVVVRLRLEEFTALFTGDMGPKVTDEILTRFDIGHVNYIKIPHHGSKNGLSKTLLEETLPEVAVISVGKNNSYGHPHKEILDLLHEFNVQILRTDLEGNIEVVTDGIGYWIKKQ